VLFSTSTAPSREAPCPPLFYSNEARRAKQLKCSNPEFGWPNGHCGLAAGPWPWEVRGGVRENEIDETVLANLTTEDLKELGVTALGHRRKLLDAIAALRNDTTGKAPLVDAAIASNTQTAYLEDHAERRQVTVMFSDLVG
jgi:SAM domain (Sterile alpha motif)